MKMTIFCAILLCTIINTVAFCQNEGSGEYLNDMHRSNVGKIAFMESFISFDKFTKGDFKEQIELSDNSEINIRMFLNDPLGRSLSQIEPSLSPENLCASGNFEFSFYVDDQLIYVEKLTYGAGTCDSKNTQTVYGIPFVRKDNPDHWGRFLWQRFMHRHGGSEALSAISQKLTVEVRPYVDLLETGSTLTGDVLAKGSVIIVKKPKKVSAKDKAIQRIQKTDWIVSKDTYDRGIIESLNEKVAQGVFKDITSIVIIKNGKLLLEEYFNGAKRKTLHDTRSLTKSFTSTLVGIAIQKGHIKSIDQKLSDFYNLKSFKNYGPEKEQITLRQLLTMSSGIEGNDSDYSSLGNEENMYPTSDWVKFALDLPMDTGQIDRWQYFTAGVVILGDILDKQVPGGLEEFARMELFEPLGIEKVKWQHTPTGVANTAGSCKISTLNLAKYGQLYLTSGEWKDREILSNSWINDSFTKHKALPFEGQSYGFLFWNRAFTVGNSKYEAFYGSGNGGNKVLVFAELDLVVVITAQAFNKIYAHKQADTILEDYILPALNFDN